MNCIRNICFLNLKLSPKLGFSESKRQIFSRSSLGLVGFQEYRGRARQSMQNVYELKQKIKNLCTDKNGMIFLDDLQKMVTITENKNDVKLLFKALRKYALQRTVIFNKHAIGTDVMRLLHVMGEPMEAVSLVEDEETFAYFKNITSCILLLDMLFKNQEYKQVIRMFEFYETSLLLQNTNGPLTELFFAACYKLNTPESFSKAIALQQQKYKVRRKPWWRSKLFFAALAVNQGQPLDAIEAISDIQFNSLAENVRLMAYAMAKRFEDIFQSTRDILQSPKVSSFFVLKDTFFLMEKQAQNFSEDISVELQKLKEELMIHNCYKNETLDEHLCTELDLKLRKKRKEVQRCITPNKGSTFDNGLRLNFSHVQQTYCRNKQ